MKPERIAKLLNDVQRNLAPGPDFVERFAGHLRSFWTPAMRKQAFELTESTEAKLTTEQQAALALLHGEAQA